MAGLRLGGLASGMDTDTVISQLMAIEALPKLRMLSQQKVAEGRKTALDDVARQLRALSTAVTDLRSVTTWADVQTISSNDDTRVSARLTGAAPPGNVTVEVSQMARVEQRTYTYTERKGIPIPGVSGNGTQRITIDGVNVDIAPGTSLQGVADLINGTSGVTVLAGVVNGQLVLTGKEVGKTIAVSSSTSSVTEDTTKQVLAQKTKWKLNGVAQDDASSAVVQTGALPGVELTLKAVTTSPVTLTISAAAPDQAAVKAKVKAFVDAYNATVDLVRGKLSETKVREPSTSSDYVKGRLRNDPALSNLLTRLRSAVGPAADSTATIDTLGEIGVAIEGAAAGSKSTPEALAGKLKLDEAKLANALASSATAVKRLLGSGETTGVAQTLEGILDPITKAATGYLARSGASADTDITRAKDRQTDFDRRLALREERLRAMFGAMETALNASQSQSAWLAGQLGSMSSSGR